MKLPPTPPETSVIRDVNVVMVSFNSGCSAIMDTDPKKQINTEYAIISNPFINRSHLFMNKIRKNGIAQAYNQSATLSNDEKYIIKIGDDMKNKIEREYFFIACIFNCSSFVFINKETF